MYRGDIRRGQTLNFNWNSFGSSGQSITRSTNGTISVYKDGGVTQTTTGVTDTEDFDGLTGVHLVTIATTDAFYAPHSDYSVVLSAATIDGQTVNAVLAEFSIENRFAGEIRAGTTATHSSTTITLAAETAPGLNFFAGCNILISDGTGEDQARTVASSTNANPPVVTLSRALVTAPSGTITYRIFPGELGPTVDEIGDDVAARTLTAELTTAGVDAIWDEALVEPTAPPAVTAAVRSAIAWFLVLNRNKITQTATTMLIKADDGTTTIGTSTVSDDGTTATRGEFA